jgi:hypothetical protein
MHVPAQTIWGHSIYFLLISYSVILEGIGKVYLVGSKTKKYICKYIKLAKLEHC